MPFRDAMSRCVLIILSTSASEMPRVTICTWRQLGSGDESFRSGKPKAMLPGFPESNRVVIPIGSPSISADWLWPARQCPIVSIQHSLRGCTDGRKADFTGTHFISSVKTQSVGGDTQVLQIHDHSRDDLRANMRQYVVTGWLQDLDGIQVMICFHRASPDHRIISLTCLAEIEGVNSFGVTR
jgi:hypothetical protein